MMGSRARNCREAPELISLTNWGNTLNSEFLLYLWFGFSSEEFHAFIIRLR